MKSTREYLLMAIFFLVLSFAFFMQVRTMVRERRVPIHIAVQYENAGWFTLVIGAGFVIAWGNK